MTRADRPLGATGYRPPVFLTRADPQLIEGQALAEMLGLPRLCGVRRCRRARLCLVPALPCLVDHAGLGRRRWTSLPSAQSEADLQRRIAAKRAGQGKTEPNCARRPTRLKFGQTERP